MKTRTAIVITFVVMWALLMYAELGRINDHLAAIETLLKGATSR